MANNQAHGDAASAAPEPAHPGLQNTPAGPGLITPERIAHRLVDALRSGDRSTAFVKGGLLMKQAFEAPDVDQQLDLGRQALALGYRPDCCKNIL